MKLLYLVMIGWVGAAVIGVRINIMASAPYGFYWITSPPETLEHGMFVIVHTPETSQLMSDLHGWLVAQIPLMKPVAAVSGEMVCRVGDQLVVGPTAFGPIYSAARGQVLPSPLAIDACMFVRPGQVFLASQTRQSLDSRYFGSVHRADVQAVAVPLLTW